MRKILLLQVEPEVTSLLRERVGSTFALEEVSGREEGIARLKSQVRDVDAVVIGPRASDPVRITQDVSAVRSDLPIMILSAPEHLDHVKRSIQFTPFLSQAIYFESIGEERRVIETFDAMAHRLAQQRRYRSMLRSARAQMPAMEAGPRRSQLYLSAMLNHMPAAVMLLDEERRTMEWNRQAAHLFDFDERARPGQDVLNLLPPSMRPPMRELIDTVADLDGGRSVLLRLNGGAKEARHVEATAAPVHDDGRRVGTIISAMDVTERIRLEDQASQLREQKAVNDALAVQANELQRLNEALRQSNEELEAFAYVASHDLQEPLRKINAFTDLLRSDFGEVLGDDGDFYLDRVQNAAGRMIELIRGLLAYSRIASRGNPFSQVDLGDIVARVLNDLEVLIEDTRADVRVGDLPRLEADPIQMRQLFQNLIGNSIKFRRPGREPVIEISCHVESWFEDGAPRAYEILLSDNGIGFDMKYAERVFAPFQRLHGRSRYEGSGMGLAICRRIAQRHGGVIRVESEPGRGSTFLITLPARHVRE